MTKDEILKHIAETGYNVGFGAKKHFATYDIVNKAPGWIGFVSLAFGIYALVFDALTAKFLSATFVVFGVVGLYITFYDPKKDDYEKVGVTLTRLYNDLGRLYRNAKCANDGELSAIESDLKKIEEQYYSSCISKQIFFSDWYAHYKFFWQHQIDWVDEQKKFGLLRDKVPLTASVTVGVSFVVLLCWYSNIIRWLCG
jgi:hypothetical protein